MNQVIVDDVRRKCLDGKSLDQMWSITNQQILRQVDNCVYDQVTDQLRTSVWNRIGGSTTIQQITYQVVRCING